MRDLTEKYLQERLTATFASEPRVKVLRREIRVQTADGRGVAGTVFLNHVASGRCFTISASAAEPPTLRALRERLDPPYRSGLLTDTAMSCDSVNERRRGHGADVPVPTRESDIEGAVVRLADAIVDVFVPRVLDVADLRPGVIPAALEQPTNYAWPVLTVLAAMQVNSIPRSDVDAERLLGKKVSRNRAFDAAALEQLGG
ncbi:MAG: hypothetical protein GX596_09875 [Propionibacterium sp.]|nr:hypothetical protein [Propionibacterium sp.]